VFGIQFEMNVQKRHPETAVMQQQCSSNAAAMQQQCISNASAMQQQCSSNAPVESQ